MLALPAEAGSRSERLLHHRRGIDEDLRVAPGLRDQPTRHGLEPRLDDLVVVLGPRVDRNRTAIPPGQDGQWIALRVLAVVQAQHDDRAYVRPERARTPPPCRSRFHPIHIAVRALGQEM